MTNHNRNSLQKTGSSILKTGFLYALKQFTESVIKVALLITIVVTVVSCSQERQPCLTPKIASLNMRFVHYTADSAIALQSTVDTALPKAIFGAITDNGLSSAIYIAPSAYFTISLSSVADSCKWRFTADSVSQSYDTLSFYYQRKLQFLSNACGYTYFYALDSVHTTHNNTDSVLITNPSVTNDVNTKQVKIFMHRNY